MCLDPSKGLSDESLETARSQNEGEEWFGLSNSNIAYLTGLIFGTIGVLGYAYVKHYKNKAIANW